MLTQIIILLHILQNPDKRKQPPETLITGNLPFQVFLDAFQAVYMQT